MLAFCIPMQDIMSDDMHQWSFNSFTCYKHLCFLHFKTINIFAFYTIKRILGHAHFMQIHINFLSFSTFHPHNLLFAFVAVDIPHPRLLLILHIIRIYSHKHFSCLSFRHAYKHRSNLSPIKSKSMKKHVMIPIAYKSSFFFF